MLREWPGFRGISPSRPAKFGTSCSVTGRHRRACSLAPPEPSLWVCSHIHYLTDRRRSVAADGETSKSRAVERVLVKVYDANELFMQQGPISAGAQNTLLRKSRCIRYIGIDEPQNTSARRSEAPQAKTQTRQRQIDQKIRTTHEPLDAAGSSSSSFS